MTEKLSKNKTITYDDVLAAVESLKAEGIHPSLRKVRDYIGRGSISTVQPILKQVMESALTVSLETDDKLRPILKSILEFNNAAVVEATNRLKIDISLLQKDLDETVNELSICESYKSDLQNEVNILTTKITALTAKLETTEKSWEETKRELWIATLMFTKMAHINHLIVYHSRAQSA